MSIYQVQSNNFGNIHAQKDVTHLVIAGDKQDSVGIFNFSTQHSFDKLQTVVLHNLSLYDGYGEHGTPPETFSKVVISNCQFDSGINAYFFPANFKGTNPSFTIYLEFIDQSCKDFAIRETEAGRKVVELTLPILYEEISKFQLSNPQKYEILSGFMARACISAEAGLHILQNRGLDEIIFSKLFTNAEIGAKVAELKQKADEMNTKMTQGGEQVEDLVRQLLGQMQRMTHVMSEEQ